MSLIFVSAFSDGLHSVGGGKWDAVPAHAATTTAALLRWTGEPVSNLTTGTTGAHRRKILSAAAEDDLLILGMAMYVSGAITTTTDGNNWALGFASDGGTTTHLTMMTTVGGGFVVRRGANSGTTITTTALGLIAPNAWNYVELKARLHDTTGTIDIRVNNNLVHSATALDTKNGGTKTVFDTVHWGRWSNEVYMTDIYIANEQGSVNNDFLGDMRVRTFFPDTEGSLIQWTPSTGTDNSDTIDETTIPPNTTDYNSDLTPGNIDRFNMTASGLDASTVIHGVQLTSYAAKTDAGARSFRHNILSDASVGTGPDKALTTTFTPHVDMFESDPDGTVPWTQAQLDAAEIGYETRA